MKKTIIALLALAGVAGAAVDYAGMNTQLQDLVKSNGYYDGSSFSLTFDIETFGTGGTVQFLTLSGDYSLCVQTQGYVGLSYNNANPSWQTDNVKVTSLGGDAYETSLTLSAPTNVWFSNTVDTSTGEAATGSYSVDGSTMTISYDSALNQSTIELTRANNVTNILTIQNYTLDVNDITFSTVQAGNVTKFIPEPATATLSLLALAGLAARRRRK